MTPNWYAVAAKVVFLAGLWLLLGRPKWTGWHFVGGLLLTCALDWIIRIAIIRQQAGG